MQDHRRALWRALTVLVVPLLLVTAYVARGHHPSRMAARAARPGLAAPLAAPAGRFFVHYGPAHGADLVAWRDRLSADSVLQRVAARLNAFVRLPTDVEIAFQQCGDDDAYYEDARITFCYEEVADYADMLDPSHGDAPVSDAITRRAEQAADFFLYHEAGHALVDVLHLPVTGKEEDAVDQFAVYVLTRGAGPDGRTDALQAADVLGRFARDDARSGEPLPTWDVHSLDSQRRANLLCWVYGSDPNTFARVVRREGLPRERRRSCADEYSQLASSWQRLLAPDLTHPGPTYASTPAQPRTLRKP